MQFQNSITGKYVHDVSSVFSAQALSGDTVSHVK